MEREQLSRRAFLARTAVAGAAVSGGGLLASCGGGDSASKSTQGTPAKSGPKRGGTLRVGVSGGSTSDSLDAHIQSNNTDGARAEQLYDHLAIRDPKFAVVNTLAESFESNAAADEWTVRLIDGVEFHNGKTLSAEDLVFTTKRILDPKTGSTQSSTLGSIDPKGMKILDDRTVRFKLTAPNAIFQELWTPSVYVVPVGYDPKNPVGTGPFKYKSFTPGRESEFVRFENYWGDAPYLDSIVMTNFTDDNARMNALVSGQVDAVDTVPFPQISVVEGTSNVKLLTAKPGEWRPLVMKTTSPPFDDNRVRMAFRLLADRQKMLEQALSGHGRLGNDLYAPQDPAFASDIPQREYDPEQAKALLKQAGHENLTVELTTSAVRGGLVEASEVFAQSAKAGGVTVKVKKVDSSILYGDQYLKWPFTVDYWPTKSYLLTAANTDGPGAKLAETDFHDAQFDKLFRQAFAELDETKRGAIIHDMQEIQHERGGYIIWAFPDQFDGYSTKVSGFIAGLSGEPFGNWNLRKVSRL